MKKLYLLFAVFLLSMASSLQAFDISGEALFVRSGEIARVDWMVTDTNPTANMQFSFDFGHGDQTAFDGSTYFYFYQIENTMPSIINTLMLNVNPDNINSAGFLVSVDLDSAPFSHFVALESETATTGPINPTTTTLSVPGVSHITWSFSNPQLLEGEYSTVLFLTSNVPPIFQLSHIGAGSPALPGTLPTPPLADVVIPEPFSMMLLGSSLIGLVIRKKRK